MRLTIGFVTVLMLLLGARAGARCPDAAAVASARAAIANTCDCDGAGSRAGYLGCVRATLAARVGAGQLPAACRAEVQRCAGASTCGRPGAVACCRVRNGASRCRVTRSAAACMRNGGTVKACPSCCDACSDGCVVTSTTTTTTIPSGQPCGLFPTCGGACPAGQTCFPYAITGSGVPAAGGCQCAPTTAQCGNLPPNCTIGACPDGGMCTAFFFAGGVECGCLAATTTTTGPTTTTTTLPQSGPCSTTGFPTCGGDCAPGEACVPLLTTGPLVSPPIAECRCAPQGEVCRSPGSNQCAVGACPAGYVCSAYLDVGVECGCVPWGTTTTTTTAPTSTAP